MKNKLLIEKLREQAVKTSNLITKRLLEQAAFALERADSEQDRIRNTPDVNTHLYR